MYQTNQVGIQTTNSELIKGMFKITIPNNSALIIWVDFFGRAANGKRITGCHRHVFTNLSGTVTHFAINDVVPTTRDSGFDDADVGYDVSGSLLVVNAVGMAGAGNTNWTAEVKYQIIKNI